MAKITGKKVDEAGIIRYYRHGVLHRLNGPAVVKPTGEKQYWIRGHLCWIQYKDGTEQVIRAAPPKPRGGDTWRPKHHSIPEPQFRVLWGGRIAERLPLRDRGRLEDLGLDQILRRLLLVPRRRLAARQYGPVRGPRWLKEATTQELIILALGGDPAALSQIKGA